MPDTPASSAPGAEAAVQRGAMHAELLGDLTGSLERVPPALAPWCRETCRSGSARQQKLPDNASHLARPGFYVQPSQPISRSRDELMPPPRDLQGFADGSPCGAGTTRDSLRPCLTKFVGIANKLLTEAKALDYELSLADAFRTFRFSGASTRFAVTVKPVSATLVSGDAPAVRVNVNVDVR